MKCPKCKEEFPRYVFVRVAVIDEYRFAIYDCVTARFVSDSDDDESWLNWAEFVECYTCNLEPIEACKPAWVS